MEKFREKLAAFMYGRNGPDALYRLLWVTSLVLILISSVIRLFVSHTAGYIIYGAAIVLLVLAMFRVFSKNLARRRRENEAYLRFKKRVGMFFARMRNKNKFRGTYIYVKCPECRNILRFKRVVGKHTATCPCCRHSFDLNIR